MSISLIPATSEKMSFEQKITYCQKLAMADLLPPEYQQKPGNILLAVEFGDSIGISPIQAIQQVHVISGKPSPSAHLVASLVRRAGHRMRITADDTKAVAQIWRSDDEKFEYRSEWTLDRAKQAELTGNKNWKKYPRAMLVARATTEVARDACPEALCGMIYCPDELGAVVDQDGNPVYGSDGKPVMDYALSQSAKKPEQVEEAVLVDSRPLVAENPGRILGERLRTVVKSTAEAMDLLAKCGLTMERGDYTVGQNGRIQWDKVLPEAAALVHAYLDKPASQPAEPEFDQETGEVSDSTVISEEVAKEIRKQRALLMLSKIDVNAIVHGGGAVQLLSPEAADEWVKQ